MPAEFDRLSGEWNGVPITGYVCYHQQDAEAAAEGGDLYLGFGSTRGAKNEAEYEASCLHAARQALMILEMHGLKSEWDGTYGHRPCVKLVWQRRKPPARFTGE